MGLYSSSRNCDIEGRAKVAVCMNFHKVIKRVKVQRMQYIIIMIKLRHRKK